MVCWEFNTELLADGSWIKVVVQNKMFVYFSPKGNVWHGMGGGVAMLVERGDQCFLIFPLFEKENQSHVRDTETGPT